MIYVTSDLHGCYDQYIRLLKAIDFKDEDTLYILGDVIDRGPNPIGILEHMKKHKNIIPLMGNHEYIAMTMFELLQNKMITRFNENEMQIFELWLEDGGRPTLNQWISLTKEKQDELLTYLHSFKKYEIIDLNYRTFILVHAGLANFHPKKSLDDYDLSDVLFDRANYNQVYYQTKYLVTGHTPTQTLQLKERPSIFKENRHFAIDCGVVFNGRLACLCLDNLKEYYIES